MKKLEPLLQIIAHIQSLNKQDWQKQLAATIAAVFLFFAGVIYFIYQKSDTQITQIRELYKLKTKSEDLLDQYQQIAQEENRITALLEKHKDFTIKSYFEKFVKDNGLTPEPAWGDSYEITPVAGSEKFEEERIVPSFKKLNTQNLIALLDKLERDLLLCLTQVTITRENDTLTATITITAKKNIKGY